MIKVLHVIPSIGPLRGGPSLALATMARSLAQAGLQVDIATTDDNGLQRLAVPLEQPVVKDGYTTWYFPRQTRFYTFSWPLTRWLAQHVREYDVVHIHALFSYSALPAFIYARRAGVPYIVRPLGVLNRWGMENRRPFLKRLSFALIERRILNNAGLVHYTSEQERLEARTLGFETASAVIPVGVEMPLVAQVSQRTAWYATRFPALVGRKVILFLSRIDPKKGLDLLLEAFVRLRRHMPDVALVLAGDGDPGFIATLHQQIEQLGLTADVFWAGFLSKEEKTAALAEADLFVLPSYSENYGIAVVEAMASGVPVVVSDQVGLSAEIGTSEAGLVVPCEVTPLANALIQLMGNGPLRQQMAANGRRLAHDRYSVEVATKQLIQVYSGFVQSPLRIAKAAT